MPDLTPSFVMEYERRMRAITEREYARKLASENQWAAKILKRTNIEGKTERFTWFLSTARIKPLGPTGAGEMSFEGLATQTVEYPTFKMGRGLRLQRDQFEDLDGTGLDEAAQWSGDIGVDIAYSPQRLASQVIMNGANSDGSAQAYDGIQFFADNSVNGGAGHPLNPYAPNVGGYCNWLHGSAGTSNTGPAGTTQPYPGALPIHEFGSGAVTDDVALANLATAWAFIKSLKMPNGIDPRFLVPRFIMGPPALATRLAMLTDAKFIARAASSGGGSADVIAYIKRMGFSTEPIIADELAGSTNYQEEIPFMQVQGALPGNAGAGTLLSETFTGSDTTWYIVCEEAQSSQLGSLLHVMRKPFKINYYTGDGGGASGMDAILDRLDILEYHCRGRQSVQLGHPYAIFRIDAS
jgi:hypothetical protein